MRKLESLPPIEERLAVSKAEAAQLLSVSVRTIDNWRREGKIGSRVLISVKSLQNLVEGNDSLQAHHFNRKNDKFHTSILFSDP